MPALVVILYCLLNVEDRSFTKRKHTRLPNVVNPKGRLGKFYPYYRVFLC